MGRFNFMDPAIRSRSSLPLCGLAVTVNARPADNLMIHKALQVATPGDVVVVSTGGNSTSAVFGEMVDKLMQSIRQTIQHLMQQVFCFTNKNKG